MQVQALFRHPIKSHGRESIQEVTLTQGQTMPWDRAWAVTHEASRFDTDTREWASCHNFMIGARTPGLAGIWARLDPETTCVTLTHQDLGEITFNPDQPAEVTRFLAWIDPLCPKDRARPRDIVSAGARGMTDSAFASVSIMNIATHHAVEQAIGGPLEIERWRGNIWLEGAAAWAEFDWMDRDLRIGGAVLRIRERIERCAHTTANPHTGLRDADTTGTLNRVFGHQDFGVYAEVIENGTVRAGDEAVLT